MVFRADGANVFKLRVVDNAGHSATLSTGTDDKHVAADVERMVKGFRSQRRWSYLTALATKVAKLGPTYDAFVAGQLDSYMAEKLGEVSDIDLEPLVAEWAKLAKPRYASQVRRFIPEGKGFPRSRFTSEPISKFLADLPVDNPTRNRYHTAISRFARWLVERQKIETNPVRHVDRQAENDPRELWMTWKDAERVARKCDSPVDTLILIMAGSGMEWGAASRLTVHDVDESAGTLYAKGSKNRWRRRTIHAEPFVWAALKRHTLRGINGELFPGIKHKPTLAAFRAAQAACQIEGHVMHDLRHTYAVNSLKAGRRPEVVAHQLGHRDASMVHRVYGRYIPAADDYSATSAATSPRRKVRR